MHLRAMLLMSMSRGAVVVAVRSGSFKQPSKLCSCLTSRCKISPGVVKRPGATFATHRKGYCESTLKQLGRPPHPQSSHEAWADVSYVDCVVQRNGKLTGHCCKSERLKDPR